MASRRGHERRKGFPYYLGWCWGGINMIISLILGAVLGGIIKRV